jgi:poly(hydroxyalkanoate) depolymerase family esterase
MRRALVAVALLALALVGVAGPAPARASRWAGAFTHHTLTAGAAYPARDYWTYVPPALPPVGQRALVIYLHGCAQPAEQAALSTSWNDLADQRGFVVAYPDQSLSATDGDPAGCWNSGQTALPRGQGEMESVAQITRAVATAYGASRVYILGVSGGALMTNVMAATYPDLYSAMGSIEGCSYLCSDPTGDVAYMRMGAYARRMPAFIVQGTLDYLTPLWMGELTVLQWLGVNDLVDDGTHNLSVSPVPTSIEHRNLDSLGHIGTGPSVGDACLKAFPRNPCPVAALGVSPYPTTVRHYSGAGGREVVQAWTIHGLSHNYPGGSFDGSFSDPYAGDITTAAFDFFESAHS